MTPKSLLGLIVFFLWSGSALAGPQPKCPEKVLDTGTVEGLYQGVECLDFCHVFITLDNGRELDFLWGEDDANKYFGQKGNRVSVNYELFQFWNEFGAECMSAEFITSGKIVDGTSPPPPKPGPKPELRIQVDPLAPPDLVGPKIKGFQMGMNETEFLKAAKRNFPFVEKICYISGHGPPVTLYALTYKDPKTAVGADGASLAGLLQTINEMREKNVELDDTMIYEAIFHVSGFYSLALANFDYESSLLQQMEFTGSVLEPLFKMSGSPAGPFLKAFGEAYHLPPPQRASGTEYLLRPDDPTWDIAVALTDSDLIRSPSAAITNITVKKKYRERTGQAPSFD